MVFSPVAIAGDENAAPTRSTNNASRRDLGRLITLTSCRQIYCVHALNLWTISSFKLGSTHHNPLRKISPAAKRLANSPLRSLDHPPESDTIAAAIFKSPLPSPDKAHACPGLT
jgi:hypothetical protein